MTAIVANASFQATVPFLTQMTPTEMTATHFVAYALRLLTASKHLPRKSCAFDSAFPAMNIFQYIMRLRKYINCSDGCFVLSGAYLSRFLQFNRDFVISLRNIHRLTLISTVTAAKFLDDAFHTNTFYAQIGGVSLSSFNYMEQLFLTSIRYSLFLTSTDFAIQELTHDNLASRTDVSALAQQLHTHDNWAPLASSPRQELVVVEPPRPTEPEKPLVTQPKPVVTQPKPVVPQPPPVSSTPVSAAPVTPVAPTRASTRSERQARRVLPPLHRNTLSTSALLPRRRSSIHASPNPPKFSTTTLLSQPAQRARSPSEMRMAWLDVNPFPMASV